MQKLHDPHPFAKRKKRKGSPLKIVLIVKLVSVLLLVACLQVTASGYSQLVNLQGKNLAMEQVFTALKKQTGYVFFYDEELLKTCKPVNANIKQRKLEECLDLLLKEQPLKYRIAGKTVIISAKPTAPVNKMNDQLSTTLPEEARILLKGRIVDENGEPVVASIQVKGTAKAAGSGADGYFSINDVEDNATLVITAINIYSQEFKLNGRNNIIIRVTIKTADEKEVIINAGYYKVRAAESTGSIGTVDAKTIERQPVTNVMQALAGRIPGLQITQQSGVAGSGINIQIRAANSLVAGTAPLFIVDGVPFPGEALYQAGGNTTGNLKPSFGSSPLNMLNPNDIESISVLKDADATAIYGSRGANGVVLISTKKAKAGKASLSMTLSTGISQVPDLHRVKTMTPEQYLEVRRQAFKNSNYGTEPDANNAPDLTVWDINHVNDWEKELFGKTSNVHDANLSFSAGTQNLNVLISGTYHQEDAVIPGDFQYRRGGVRIVTNYQTVDNRFSISTGVTYNVDKNEGVARVGAQTDLAAVAYSYPFNFPLYKEDGNLYWYPSGGSFYVNPLSYQHRIYNSNNSNLLGNIGLRFNPVKNIALKVDGSMNRAIMDQTDFNYSKAINPYLTSSKPSALYQQNKVQTWNLEPTAEYQNQFGDLKMSLLAGTTFQNSKFVQPFYISASNFSSDAMLRNYTSAGTLTIYSYDSEYKYTSAFGRLNLNWKGRYILNTNYRWDASSKFGVNNRTGSFGSVGGAWIISEENFVKDKLPFLSFAKIRGSFGYSGNDQIGNYMFSDNYTTTVYQYDGLSTMIPSNIANPNLEWEVNKKTEIAAEIGLFKNRIFLTASLYKNSTSNPLARFPLSSPTGFASYLANIDATIEMTGWELSLNTRNITGKGFTWDTYFNFSVAKNKLAKFNDIDNSTYINDKIVGESLSDFYGYHYTGIEKSTSLPMVEDADGNGTVTDYLTGLAKYGKGDFVKIGNYDPAFFGGLNNSFGYKGVKLDVFFRFVGKRMIKGIAHYDYSSVLPGYQARNMTDTYYKLFKETGGKLASVDYDFEDDAPLTRHYLYANSDATISNAAFIRLQNVSLSYDIPARYISKLSMSRLNLFVNAQNLLTITSFEGYDPESMPSNIPPLRTFVFGLRATF